jgi:hypothetical protein
MTPAERLILALTEIVYARESGRMIDQAMWQEMLEARSALKHATKSEPAKEGQDVWGKG